MIESVNLSLLIISTIFSILILPANLSLRNNRISDKQLLIKILPVHVYRCDLAIVICGVIVDSLVAVAA